MEAWAGFSASSHRLLPETPALVIIRNYYEHFTEEKAEAA